jgi:hypothetical protein
LAPGGGGTIIDGFALFRVVKDDADRVPLPRAKPADAVAHVDPVVPLGAANRRLWTAKATASPCQSGTGIVTVIG